MADSASEVDLESDTSSVDGNLLFPGGSRDCESRTSVSSAMMVETTKSSTGNEEHTKRMESIQQENRVLKMEVETYKLKCKQLQEDNRELRKASVSIQAKAEQEEEFISNTLLKKIDKLKKEKETLAMNYEQEEEYLTNDLSRKLMQLRQEKAHLEETLEREQEFQVNKLMRKIEKLESETMNKQITLEQLRREKIELENSLEQEQESLVNRLWKRMEKLEAEKRMLQEKLNEPVSAPPSPRDALMLHDGANPPPVNASGNANLNTSVGSSLLCFPPPMSNRERRHSSGPALNMQHSFCSSGNSRDAGFVSRLTMPPPAGPDSTMAINLQTAGNLTQHIQNLRQEVHRLREGLRVAQKEHADKMAQYMQEEKHIRDENLRLQRRLQLETERRENLCRHLSESESSLEMDEERHFHEMATGHPLPFPTSPASNPIPHAAGTHRSRTASSPIPYAIGSAMPPSATSRPMSPAGSLSTSIPKTGALLMEASLGLSASATSVTATSVPNQTSLLTPAGSAHGSGRCPNCGHVLHGPALSPVGPVGIGVVVTASAPLSGYSHSLAPVPVLSSLSRGEPAPSLYGFSRGDHKPMTSSFSALDSTTSPPVALVRPQATKSSQGASVSTSSSATQPAVTQSAAKVSTTQSMSSLPTPVSVAIPISRPETNLQTEGPEGAAETTAASEMIE